MWVLILFHFSGGNPAVAMHDSSNKASCEHALAAPSAVQLRGIPQVTGVCVPK
jgi:hypothetical protein